MECYNRKPSVNLILKAMINKAEGSKRILSLDVFRGFTIVLMILVNSQGDSSYPILVHASWNGCTPADLVFPFFLFIVGITIVISLQKYLLDTEISRKILYYSIVKRALILFLFGVLLNAFPHHFDFATLRYYGVLQRIAVCYLVCSVLYLNFTPRTQILTYIIILVAYWILMTFIPVPGIGANQLTESGTWVAYVDQLLFTAPHLFGKVYDTEGFISTFPAIATTLSGVLTGMYLLTLDSPIKILNGMLVAGALLMGTGWLWGYSFPINKNLWTSSFVLWTSGCALILFSIMYWVIDMKKYIAWALPFKIFGMNALFAFIFHVYLLKIQYLFTFTTKNGDMLHMRPAITNYLFGSFSPQNASLLYSILFLGFNFIIVAILYRHKIFFRV